MTRQIMLVCLLGAVLLLPAVASAEHTRYWRESDFSEFEKGTAKGVAIRSDGKLMPALQFSQFADPNLAYLWTLRFDSHGKLFAAGGSDAKVLRIDEAGKPTVVFEAPELTAQAIVFDGKDNLYVGTSPDGKVYKVTPDGRKSVFFEPKTKYIWALAVDSQGTLFVATGDTGQVFAVSPDGQGKVFYQSQQRHARSLTISPKGDLLIGTEPDGLILRVGVEHKGASALPDAGAAFVIYETDKAEITSLVQDAAGNLYASSVGEKNRVQAPVTITASNPAPSAPATVTARGATVTIVSSETPASSQAPFPFPANETGGAQVVKIAADGSPETVWTSGGNLVFSMGLTASGKLLLGTSDKGTIVELEGNRVYSSIAKTAAAQVTSLVASPGGKIFVATANPGKIFELGPNYESGGTFESETFDAKIFSHWGRLTWGDNDSQGKIALYARSGNTSNPENNWSSWAGPYTSTGNPMGCPPARFVQWKAVFLASSAGEPNISWVNLAYQPKNVAPEIDDIAIQSPGVRIASFGQPSGNPSSSSPVPLTMPQGPGGTSSAPPADIDNSGGNFKVEVPLQGFRDKAYQSVIWSAHDDNDDSLEYALYYREASATAWQLLKDKLAQRFYAWDTVSIPDGVYYLKVVGSDSPSNPSDQALSAERESDRFQVANTPPRIDGLHADTNASPVKIMFDGESFSGAIAQAQYSVDSGDWQPIFPAGLLSDAPKESYEVGLSGLGAGEHIVAVKITDRFDNTSSAQLTIAVKPRPTI